MKLKYTFSHELLTHSCFTYNITSVFVTPPREPFYLKSLQALLLRNTKKVSSNLTASKWKDSYCNKNLQVKKNAIHLYDIKLNTPFCLFHEVIDIYFYYRCDNKTAKNVSPF